MLFFLFIVSLYVLNTWAHKKIYLSEPKIIKLEKGETLTKFSNKLYYNNLIDSGFKFKLWVKVFSDYSKFQSGKYKFENSVTPYNISVNIISGKTYEPVVVKYTIPECFTLKKIIARLTSLGIGTKEEFEKLSTSKQFLASLNIPVSYLEGYFYPSTYSFTRKISAKEAIQVAVELFWKKLPQDYESRVNNLGISLHQAVIFASLIEAETMYVDEKPLIAEVIWNRLKNKIPLGIDAAIIYGIKDYNGDLKWIHLKDRNNKYNTRIYRGLPPTPICSPSLSALKAVVSFSNQGYMYYVINPLQKNRHIFSRTFKEHNRNVQKLIKYQKTQK